MSALLMLHFLFCLVKCSIKCYWCHHFCSNLSASKLLLNISLDKIRTVTSIVHSLNQSIFTSLIYVTVFYTCVQQIEFYDRNSLCSTEIVLRNMENCTCFQDISFCGKGKLNLHVGFVSLFHQFWVIRWLLLQCQIQYLYSYSKGQKPMCIQFIPIDFHVKLILFQCLRWHHCP